MNIAASPPDRVFHALSDPSRRAIFESLAAGEVAVKGLTERFAISQPAISQHLAALRDAGLVKSRRQGRYVYYQVDPAGMEPLIDWIGRYHAFWTQRVKRLESLLERMEE